MKTITTTFGTMIAFATLAVPFASQAVAESDWDLYIMRLVNRARVDPAGEAARIGSLIVDESSPVPPLAYMSAVGDAATSHNTWMHENLGSIASGFAPDSFSHYETLDGAFDGTPAVGTPSYTGAGLGERITFAGYSWSAAGENITAGWATFGLVVDMNRMDGNHFGWWESAGHRANMLNSNFTTFGHHADTRTIAPPIGGIPAPFDTLHFATQNFARPLSTPHTHLFGVLYEDLNTDGEWTPREATDPMREGLSDVTVEAWSGGSLIASAVTSESGAFALNVGNATYDVLIHAASGTITLPSIQLAGANINVGDIAVGGDVEPCLGDIDESGDVGVGDLLELLAAWGLCDEVCPADLDQSGDVGVGDLLLLLAAWGNCN